jgi:hypothetical protein
MLTTNGIEPCRNQLLSAFVLSCVEGLFRVFTQSEPAKDLDLLSVNTTER